MLTGLNHLTLAVSDLDRSFDFYRHLLGFTPHARWQGGAYLSLGTLWLCLSLDEARTQPRARDYTHYAFSVAPEHIERVSERLRQSGAEEWKSNRSEGESLYFLDPDGHQLEIHAGDLASRLAACREKPYQGMVFY
ncbi:fosfomycin resistance glutathione transferase [Serratia marcescens]|jgi:catechol 2,3-dioxygenase-like lactoylglutathione lyase family enzyme|nr:MULTISPECIES: fosfomycin resistance glutathione transferase [Serratia]MBH2639079.1 fosfomycin resistance glutathione transferase [Serratia ureilytica]MBH3022089.1 fosfomycin resistance glutathione transferase [Serratia ureilytica]MBJ2112237.1 fosfomycin resistance glutathione transferase [Serratia ureilytica]MBN5223166.1 fosfomycin resistance glutathione transferase [Serratia ureilytica]PNO40675.1 fosfomycin resistance glutathione transferase [Serratia marcescens]